MGRTELVAICLECLSFLDQKQLPQHVLYYVPTPQIALHGDLTPAIRPAGAGSRKAPPLSELWMMLAAFLVSKETLDMIVLVMIWQAPL
jgi:hypothetical protein